MKDIYNLKIVFSGDNKNNCPSAHIFYRDARGHEKTRSIPLDEIPSSIFNEGTAGEFWCDTFSVIESLEGIS